MRKRKRAFTLIELLVVVAIIALLISILLPSLSRARELSKRLLCDSNLKGMGTAFKIYANDYEEHWPTPTFNDKATTGILYAPASSNAAPGIGWPTPDTGSIQLGVTPNRRGPSDATTTSISVTRAMWMLVRSGDVTQKSYICPSSGDTIDAEQNIDLFYDFKGYTNVSYGYQVPFGPFDTRASENIDPRMAVGADKGPYGTDTVTDLPAGAATWDQTNPDALTPQDWLKYNSPNHGGTGTGEGENVLYADGHATFEKKPIVGIDLDNIYTIMTNVWGTSFNGRASGALVRTGVAGAKGGANKTHPGYLALGTKNASTDSLIYP